MDRDPIAFTWRTARREHAAAVGLALGLGGPLALLALLCLRDLVGVQVHDTDPTGPFLRIAAALPWRPAAEGPFVAFAGWILPHGELVRAAFLGLAAAALASAGLGWAVARLCFHAQTRTVAALQGRVTEAILRAPPGARDEARALAQAMGDLLARLDTLFGLAILVPALAVGGTVLALVLAGLAAPRLVATVAAGLLAAGLARALIQRRMQDRAALRLRAGGAAGRALADLIRRMPAVRAHGAAAFERERLAAKGASTRDALAASESALAYARAPSMALAILLPAIVVAVALWRGHDGTTEPVEPGALLAAAGGFALAVVALTVTLRMASLHRILAGPFRDVAVAVPALEGRAPARPGTVTALPEAGALVAQGVGAYDPATGERLAGVDAALPMPGHVAILGERGSGSRVLAAILAGQLEPSAGAVTYGGIDLRAFEPEERARRIALAGAEAILIEGSLRQNILYGASGTPDPDDLIATLRITGLDAFAYARGLEGTVDPAAEPEIARAVVAARHAVREALAADKAGRLVEPFDPARYNHQATVGENILFGEAVGPAFASDHIAAHPYLRAVLEAEGLSRPLTEIGLQVARSLVEIFADLPDDHPLFETFSLFPAAERGFFEDLVGRQPEAKGWRRGPAGQRDRKRLIGLALRYSETRHRFGLIDAAFEERLVEARRSFARLMPANLRGTVEFYDPARLTAAASLEENILFGRINGEEAGAEARVRALVRRVLADEGLEPAVYRLGLESRVEPGLAGGGASLGENAIGPRERIAIDLARCLVRRPDIVVIAIALEDRKGDEIRARLAALRAARAGRGLIVCLPDAEALAGVEPFDAVLRIERNTVLAA
ncbi:multidrug ABC transporter ATP-binding protein [Methylobacterium sp. Leaf94]|uniref:ABC transporter transmembrane domain-containing protein n=1 Tax=Methylobacterium sp. Leaf94 TaxID=1736250 RepID=UPI000700E35D|nr:ABC transporter transmembrane domain-containing protein [Methylobacterium sp. Leaf94]KQU34366.1 multidrug ABC transporter ATP-binding protein [Methylobacterium sp. Leaf94]